MLNQEKFTVEIQKYAIVNGHVILFDVNLNHSAVFDKDETISSAGLVCIWRKGSMTQVICCDEGISFSVSSKPETDQQLIAQNLGIAVNNINQL